VRLARASAVVAACCIVALPMPGSAQATAPRTDGDRPSVRVSRDELRIVFPRDTAHRWGWSAPLQPGFAPRYSWGMQIDAIEGPRYVHLDVSSLPLPREFRSLRDLVSAGRGHLCSAGMATVCGEIRLTGTVENGRPVLTLRDSALISWLFALRPATVLLSQDRPERDRLITRDSVRIDYALPSVRPLDSATRATALRARRRESRERFSVHRAITERPGLTGQSIWLTVGDSVPLWLSETESSYDMHWPGQRDLTDSGWVVLEPRIAQLLRPSDDKAPLRESRAEARQQKYVDALTLGPPRMYVKALRPGATTIRVRGVHGRLDAAFESALPSGVLERDLVVIRPPHRLEITPRPDTLRVGQYLEARVRVYDATGESTERVPVALTCTGCVGSYYDGVLPSTMWSNTPGRMTVVARLNGLADTLSIVVVDTVRQ
jgi:hypothetical protein